MAKQHLVLVHGACHVAWCWYKVATLLQRAGHRVTALDLAASGADEARIADVPAFEDYSRPLLDAVRGVLPGEKVVLVGHSLGGLSLALAMETFPEKVAAAVFVSAFLPDTLMPLSYAIEKDVTLARSLVRPAKAFMEEMRQREPFSENRFGSVDASYVVCSRDLAIGEAEQLWMLERRPVKAVRTIDTDHMAMLSAPQELYQCLHGIATVYH